MLFRSIDDRKISGMLPKTFKTMENWDAKELPGEPVYAALYEDLSYLKETKTYGKIIARLNYEKSGFSSLIKKTVRKLNKFEEGNYKEQFIKVHKRWGQNDVYGCSKKSSPQMDLCKIFKRS